MAFKIFVKISKSASFHMDTHISYSENQFIGSKLSIQVRRETVHVSSSTLNLIPSWYLCDAIYVWHYCEHHTCDTMWFNILSITPFLNCWPAFPPLFPLSQPHFAQASMNCMPNYMTFSQSSFYFLHLTMLNISFYLKCSL